MTETPGNDPPLIKTHPPSKCCVPPPKDVTSPAPTGRSCSASSAFSSARRESARSSTLAPASPARVTSMKSRAEIAPGTRVVYVDNDPIVHVHANALLTSSGSTRIVLADLREPDKILTHPKTRDLIDFSQPVALLLVAILHFIADDEDPAGLVAALRDALPPGSYLGLSHATNDFRTETAAVAAAVYNKATSPATLRSHAQIAAFFGDWALVDPGLVQVPLWRPDGPPPGPGTCGGCGSTVASPVTRGSPAGQVRASAARSIGVPPFRPLFFTA